VIDITEGGLSVSIGLYVVCHIRHVHPAKAVGRNEVPFGRDTRVIPSRAYGPGPHGKRIFGGRNTQFALRSDVPIAKLL